MSKWLYLGPRREDRWMGLLSKRDQTAVWMDRAPGPEDLESVEFVVEAYVEEDMKTAVLGRIAACQGWKGHVASLISSGSATTLSVSSGLDKRLAGFHANPEQGELRAIELLHNDITQIQDLKELKSVFEEIGLTVTVCRDQAGGILARVLVSMINEASYLALYGVADMEKIDR